MPFAAFLLVGAVALGGCSGEEAPEPSVSVSSGSSTASATPSASVTPSPTVTESGPPIPAAAREQTEAGAIAYANFFFDQFNIAWTEPREGLIASLSDPECLFCAKTEETAARLVKDEERYDSTPVKLTKVEPLVGAPDGQQFLVATLEQQRAQILAADGSVVGTDEQQVADRYLVLIWAEDRWRMLEVEKTA